MFIEQGLDLAPYVAFAPFVAITLKQVKAIFERDNGTCMFPSSHNCHGKLTVHHIDGKEDDPANLISVCRCAHWNHLHSKCFEEQSELWKDELFAIAEKRTENALKKGWKFLE